MMKKDHFRLASLLLVFCLMLGAFAVSAGNAYAEGEKWTILANEQRWVGDQGDVVAVCDDNSWQGEKGPIYATVTSVKSSDTTVLAPKKETMYSETGKEKGYILNAKRPGTATVTVNYKTPYGEKGSLEKSIIVKKYPYEIKSLKVNGKTVKVSKHKFFLGKRTSKKSVSVKMTLKKGWKISNIYGYKYSKSGNNSKVKVTKKMIKKGTAISFPKGYNNMYISVYMTNGEDTINYNFSFYR